MASWRSTGAAGAALAAATLLTAAAAAPARAADAPLTPVTVSPSTVHPGGSVDLRTFADCGGGTGTVLSEAFAGPVTLGPAAGGGIFGHAAVSSQTRPGTYRVVDVCGDSSVAVGQVTVRRVGAIAAGGGWGALRGTAGAAHGNPAAEALVGAALAAALARTARRRVRG